MPINSFPLLMGTITVLLVIAYQDLRYRAVTWIFFPLLAILGIVRLYMIFYSIPLLLWSIIGNLAFIAIQLLFLALYFSIKYKKSGAVLNKKIGTGDILFLLASSCFFMFPDFILFYIISLLVSLIAFVCFIKRNSKTIPLAGLQALFLMILLITDIFIPLDMKLYLKLASI